MARKNSNNPTWLFVFLLVLGLILIAYEFSSSKNSPQQSRLSKSQFQQEDPKKLELVNRHLKETALNLEQQKVNQKIEAQQTLNQYKNTEQQNVYSQTPVFSFESDPNMQQLTSDLNRSFELSEGELTPEQMIQNELLRKQIVNKQSQAYLEAYMKQFVENARAGGWEIKLGPNLEIISVKKIRPRQPSTINQ